MDYNIGTNPDPLLPQHISVVAPAVMHTAVTLSTPYEYDKQEHQFHRHLADDQHHHNRN